MLDVNKWLTSCVVKSMNTKGLLAHWVTFCYTSNAAHCHTTKCNLDFRKSDARLLKAYELISLRNHNGA